MMKLAVLAPWLTLVPIAAAPFTAAQEALFEEGPLAGKLGSVATIDVPEGYLFCNKAGMPALNAATGNLHSPNDVGAITPVATDEDQAGWIVFFSFDPVGYVEDEEEELDAGDLLATMKEGDTYANEERRKQGYPELHTLGWSRPPYYDSRTNNLTWGLRLGTDQGEVLNHQVRLLGRRGVMEVTLVASPDELEPAAAELDTLLASFDFDPGQRYSEYVSGDKVAEYGLAGLVLGGGILAAGKLGILAKLGKFIKVIVVGVAVAVAGAVRWLRNWLGGREPATEPPLDTPES